LCVAIAVWLLQTLRAVITITVVGTNNNQKETTMNITIDTITDLGSDTVSAISNLRSELIIAITQRGEGHGRLVGRRDEVIRLAAELVAMADAVIADEEVK
jgi:hypothetical protein